MIKYAFSSLMNKLSTFIYLLENIKLSPLSSGTLRQCVSTFVEFLSLMQCTFLLFLYFFYSIILPNLRVHFKLCLSVIRTFVHTTSYIFFYKLYIFLPRLRVTLPPSGHSITHTHNDI